MSKLSSHIRKHSLVEDLFGDMNPGFFIRPLHGEPLPNAIKLEIKENKNYYNVIAELPGLRKEDIQVSVENKIVTISAEIQQQDAAAGEEEKVLHTERYYGRISRSIELPTEVDLARAHAKYEHGLLSLQLPKKIASSAQRLTIS